MLISRFLEYFLSIVMFGAYRRLIHICARSIFTLINLNNLLPIISLGINKLQLQIRNICICVRNIFTLINSNNLLQIIWLGICLSYLNQSLFFNVFFLSQTKARVFPSVIFYRGDRQRMNCFDTLECIFDFYSI